MNPVNLIVCTTSAPPLAPIRNGMLVGLLCLLVVSCGSSMSNGSNCNDFYKDGIKFSLTVGEPQKRFFLQAGQSQTESFNVTGKIEKVADATINRTVVCKPSWQYSPNGVVTVAPNPATDFGGEYLLTPTTQASNASGSIVKITGTVFGSGAPAQDHIWAVVTNESEPNDGPPGAHPLINALNTVGGLSPEDPSDWHVLKVAPRKAYQIRLITPNLDTPDLELNGTLFRIKPTTAGLNPTIMAASIVNEEDLEAIPNGINSIRVNNSDTDLTVFVKVQAKDGTTLPDAAPVAYQLKSIIYDPVGSTSRPVTAKGVDTIQSAMNHQ
jgi:hypothetical protein